MQGGSLFNSTKRTEELADFVANMAQDTEGYWRAKVDVTSADSIWESFYSFIGDLVATKNIFKEMSRFGAIPLSPAQAHNVVASSCLKKVVVEFAKEKLSSVFTLKLLAPLTALLCPRNWIKLF